MKKIYYSLLFVIIVLSSCVLYTDNQFSILPGKSLKDWEIDGNRVGIDCINDIFHFFGQTTLYYTGKVNKANFINFELVAEIKTEPGAIGALWFHSSEISGYQILINNTPDSEEHRKTGSLSGVRNVYKSMAADHEWFTLRIRVVGKHVTVRVNDILVVDYVEPDEPFRTEENKNMRFSHGALAISSYTNNRIMIRSLEVTPMSRREIPDRTDAIDEQNDDIIRLQQANFPVIDFHVHLKGWDQHEAMDYSRKTGIFYGFAPNCGIGFPVTSDEDIYIYLDTTKNLSSFQAMQGEGREWVTTFSEKARMEFDYVFTDALTFTDHKGRRTRLWIPEEVHIDITQEQYMDIIVDRIVKVLKEEPINVYVNPTFLPDEMMPDYDKYWTDARINKVIEALMTQKIALEINARYCIPNEKIIKAAKNAGIRFIMGTNNADSNIGKLEYCIEMIEKCEITERDMFFPVVKPVRTQ